MLRGAPNTPAYRRDEVPTAVSRLALSDLQYSDFSGGGTFFTAQTDWSAGFKNERTWKDDAKFYYSTNIDAYSEPGAFKLMKTLMQDTDFSQALYGGIAGQVNSGVESYVYGYEDGSGYPKVYRNVAGTWTDIATTTFGTNGLYISQALPHKNKLFACCVGTSGNIVKSHNGSAWTDHTAGINGVATGGGATGADCETEFGGSLYIAVNSGANNRVSIVSTADAGTTWAEEITFASSGAILDMIGYAGLLYYILYTGVTELHAFDPSTNADTTVSSFYNASFLWQTFGTGNRLLKVLGGKLIITIPPSKIYEYDGNTLTTIFTVDAAKNASGSEAGVNLSYGCVEYDTRLRWGNLIYDGEAWFNSQKDYSDSTTAYYIPLFVDTTNLLYGLSTTDQTYLYKEHTSNYKPTLAKNILVFSEMSPVVSIDKLLYVITLAFDALNSGEQIAAEYSTNFGSSWTALDTMTSTSESSNVKRDFFIPNSVLYNKLLVRVKLKPSTSGSTTPVIRDVIVGYKPIPNYKNRWQLRLEMSNGVKLLNDRSDENTGSDLLGGMWNEKATKQTVLFEDVDYVQCSLMTAMSATQTSASVDSTIGFPRRGRIRAVSAGVAEEMIYTSAESKKLLGMSRAQRGTRARAYLSGQVLKNDYTAYIERMESTLNFTDERKTESIATVTLLEA